MKTRSNLAVFPSKTAKWNIVVKVDCRKDFLKFRVWPTGLYSFLNQSQVKPTPITTKSYVFFYAYARIM